MSLLQHVFVLLMLTFAAEISSYNIPQIQRPGQFHSSHNYGTQDGFPWPGRQPGPGYEPVTDYGMPRNPGTAGFPLPPNRAPANPTGPRNAMRPPSEQQVPAVGEVPRPSQQQPANLAPADPVDAANVTTDNNESTPQAAAAPNTSMVGQNPSSVLVVRNQQNLPSAMDRGSMQIPAPVQVPSTQPFSPYQYSYFGPILPAAEYHPPNFRNKGPFPPVDPVAEPSYGSNNVYVRVPIVTAGPLPTESPILIVDPTLPPEEPDTRITEPAATETPDITPQVVRPFIPIFPRFPLIPRRSPNPQAVVPIPSNLQQLLQTLLTPQGQFVRRVRVGGSDEDGNGVRLPFAGVGRRGSSEEGGFRGLPGTLGQLLGNIRGAGGSSD